MAPILTDLTTNATHSGPQSGDMTAPTLSPHLSNTDVRERDLAGGRTQREGAKERR